MKAIQVKVLPATNTKPTRLKAWAWGWDPITRSASACEDAGERIGRPRDHVIALELFALNSVNHSDYYLVFGTLPNGDTVATLEKR